MSTRSLTTIYFSVGIIFIALDAIGIIYPAIIAKALIIPILFFMYYRLVKGQMNNFHMMIMSALIFSWLGDITLEFQRKNDIFFMIGLSCFLAAQIIYLIAFFSTKGPNVLIYNKVYLLLPVMIYGIIIICLLYGGLGDMKVPVIVYTVVILTMLASAINREKKVNRQSYILVMVGAILFILSDTILAINKFGYPFNLAGIANMLTYIAAQYLIVIGCLKQFEIELK